MRRAYHSVAHSANAGAIVLAIAALASPAAAQDFTIRGFGELQSAVYPQVTPQDDDRIAVDGRFRFEPAYRAASWLVFSGSFEARAEAA